ncbi:MAG: response regulator [Betaproteobacteria bacterium]
MTEDGNQAVEKAGKTAYAIILMDMQMPSLDGLEATPQIRKLSELHGKMLPRPPDNRDAC